MTSTGPILLVAICMMISLLSVSSFVQYGTLKAHNRGVQSTVPLFHSGHTILFGRAERRMAKQNKGKGPKIIQGAGFGGATTIESEVPADSTVSEVETAAQNKMENTINTPLSANTRKYTPSDNPEQDLQNVFAKYGIEDTDPVARAAAAKKPGNAADGTGAFGEAVLAGIPAKLQGQIDNILITTTFFALSLVVLTGVGMSASALEIVFPGFKLDPTVNQLITNVLVPNFTPFFCFFFAVSITLGLFKYAQISSEATVYKE